MARRGGFPGGGMPGNMANLMKQAQKMQKQMEDATKELEEKEMTASAGGGVVEVTVSGKREVTKIKIDPEAVDPDDVEMLEDLIMAQFFISFIFVLNPTLSECSSVYLITSFLYFSRV